MIRFCIRILRQLLLLLRTMTSRWSLPANPLTIFPLPPGFFRQPPFRSDSPPPGPSSKQEEHPNIDGESLDSDEEDEADDRLGKSYSQMSKAGQTTANTKHNHPRSPYGTTATRTPLGKKMNIPFPARSHQSLPPPPRTNPMATSTQSLGRQSVHERDLRAAVASPKPASTAPSRVLQKFKKSNSTPAPVAINAGISATMLPEDLRKCLEVIEDGILEGHRRLSESLRKRYDDQFPLVRSLADVFVSHVSNIFLIDIKRYAETSPH